jgi:methionyl-tRNA synthetase
LYDNSIIQRTEQLKDAKADQFLADRFVTGTCPNVANEEAHIQCGKWINA